LLQLLDQQINGLLIIKCRQNTTQLVHNASLVRVEQQLILTSTRRINIHSWENAALRDLTIQLQLSVTSALELLEDHGVTSRAGLHHGSCDDGQRSTIFDVSSSTQETLRRVQCIGIHTTGQNTSRCR